MSRPAARAISPPLPLAASATSLETKQRALEPSRALEAQYIDLPRRLEVGEVGIGSPSSLSAGTSQQVEVRTSSRSIDIPPEVRKQMVEALLPNCFDPRREPAGRFPDTWPGETFWLQRNGMVLSMAVFGVISRTTITMAILQATKRPIEQGCQ